MRENPDFVWVMYGFGLVVATDPRVANKCMDIYLKKNMHHEGHLIVTWYMLRSLSVI